MTSKPYTTTNPHVLVCYGNMQIQKQQQHLMTFLRAKGKITNTVNAYFLTDFLFLKSHFDHFIVDNNGRQIANNRLNTVLCIYQCAFFSPVFFDLCLYCNKRSY